MQIKVKVIPGSSEDKVTKKGDEITIKVKAQARKGQANLAATLLLQEFLKKPVRLIRGQKAKTKIFEVSS